MLPSIAEEGPDGDLPRERDHGGTCYKTVHRCKTCGSVGCDQGAVSKCTNKNFQYGKCLKCGKSGKEPV